MTKTEKFLMENNIDVEDVLYSEASRRIIVNEDCVAEGISAADFVRGVAERQRQIGLHIHISIV